MLVDVTLLRRKGLRLKPPELEPPVRGELETSWMSETSLGRPMMVAQVLVSEGISRRALVTLLDVRLEAILPAALSLSGIEIESDARQGEVARLIEHRQVWRCVPIATPG